MAGIIAQLPGGEAQFVPIAPQLLAGCISEVARRLRHLLRPALGLSEAESEQSEEQETWAACAAQGADEDYSAAAKDTAEDDFRLLYRERDLEDETNAAAFLKAFDSGRPVLVRILFRLLGGKGGFGSLLRSQKGGKKTTNFDAMRDLTGRRVRHAKAVERIKTWIENKKRDDELVELLTGEGPELPKPTPESEMLDPEFVRKLKRAAATRPAVVSEGLRRIATESNGGSASSAASAEEPKKRPRYDEASASSATSTADSVDWLGALDALGDLSSSGEEDGEEASSKAAAAPAGVSSVASSAKPLPVVAPPAPPKAAPPQVAPAAPKAASNGTTAAVVPKPASSETAAAPKPAAPAPVAPKAAAAPPQVFEPLKVEDLKKYRSAEELAEKVPAEALKLSLQQLGLKCGGRPEERAKRLFELKDKALKDLPKSFFAAPAKDEE